jgi:hypothetical protein
MTTDMHNAPSVAQNPGDSRDNATAVARYDLSTSEGGRGYISHFFATELRRHDFADYIVTRLAADFACALAQHLAATGKQQVGDAQRDGPLDVTDPWRGLYLPASMPAPSEYGDLTHPDIPLWPDEREDALDKLVHAQGFDFHIVAGDFTEAALEDGDDLYWQEMRAWNPEAPEGEWRLAWKGDTEDGPYAWFVRPMALRPDTAAPPAQGVDLEHARDEGHDGAIRYVLGYLNGVGDWGSTQYVEILNACGRERIIHSAVQNGELEFTGLGRWVAERGTDQDRALIDQRDAAQGVAS